jgi:hypothetical protein
MIEALKKVNWKGFFSGKVFLVILAAGLAFGIGRCTGPTKIVESTKTIETRHEVETTQQKVDLSEILKAIKNTQVDTNKTRTVVRIVKPDGTQITTEKDTSQQAKKTTTQTESQTQLAVKTDTKKQEDTVVIQEKIRTVETLRAPTWGVGVLAGVSLPGIAGKEAPKSYLGVPSNYVLGVMVERKVIGSLKVGIWGNTRLDTGVQLSLGF